MEAVILFLLKAAASGTAGHYLKKALTKIDSEVGAMFASGASVEEIEKTIERKDVSAQVNEIFQESIKTSTILSDGLSVAATPDDVVQTIEVIVSLGFGIAYKENFDLALPGSPLTPDSLSIFQCSTGLGQDVSVDDRSITWNRYKAELLIIPMKHIDLDKYWQSYLAKVRELRAGS